MQNRMSSNYVFGASMSPEGMTSTGPRGFLIPMSPAFGDACGSGQQEVIQW